MVSNLFNQEVAPGFDFGLSTVILSGQPLEFHFIFARRQYKNPFHPRPILRGGERYQKSTAPIRPHRRPSAFHFRVSVWDKRRIIGGVIKTNTTCRQEDCLL
jgi:hypothetical protein